ncbi:MFS transporter [Leucobacter chironomi]|uniref:MFS transporter n=1 Tax=Leucobacter chironomi TaxID=491918 RepID=UPI00041F9AF1|nr:MFS transporter [Leucobacter chironomi]
MAERAAFERGEVVRWVRTVPVVFLLVGMGFGTWLSRLPAVRDQLGASATEMSVYGLCLAVGSLAGLMLSGRIVHRFGPRRTIFVGTIAMTITLPSAAAIIVSGAIPPGLVVLFAYGFAFSICDVAMNVSGANAEAAFGRPRMPLMHAGYSLGAVAATGLGGLAEALRVPVPVHFAAVMLVSAVALFALLRNLPRDEYAARSAAERASVERDPATGPIPVIDSAAGQQPAFTTVTGSIPVQRPGLDGAPGDGTAQAPGSARPYSPWRDPRIFFIGLLTLSFGLFEGTASDWLPLALVDGRGLSNQLGSVMLSVFFAAVMAVRIAGSWLILRFGRVPVLRASAVLAAAGVVMTILLPGTAGAVVGVLAWGVGTSLGWPIAISAAADRADTAARDVAAVSALGYGSMLVGPMAFGFLGEHIGLLSAFWALLPFAVYVLFAASATRSRR